MILLDTHVAHWFTINDPRLGRRAWNKIQNAFEMDRVALSSFTVWDAGYQVKRGRVLFPDGLTIAQWWDGLLAQGVTELVANSAILFRAFELAWAENDPADRIIVATALHHNIELVTADRNMLDWNCTDLKTLNARK